MTAASGYPKVLPSGCRTGSTGYMCSDCICSTDDYSLPCYREGHQTCEQCQWHPDPRSSLSPTAQGCLIIARDILVLTAVWLILVKLYRCFEPFRWCVRFVFASGLWSILQYTQYLSLISGWKDTGADELWNLFSGTLTGSWGIECYIRQLSMNRIKWQLLVPIFVFLYLAVCTALLFAAEAIYLKRKKSKESSDLIVPYAGLLGQESDDDREPSDVEDRKPRDVEDREPIGVLPMLIVEPSNDENELSWRALICRLISLFVYVMDYFFLVINVTAMGIWNCQTDFEGPSYLTMYPWVECEASFGALLLPRRVWGIILVAFTGFMYLVPVIICSFFEKLLECVYLKAAIDPVMLPWRELPPNAPPGRRFLVRIFPLLYFARKTALPLAYMIGVQAPTSVYKLLLFLVPVVSILVNRIRPWRWRAAEAWDVVLLFLSVLTIFATNAAPGPGCMELQQVAMVLNYVAIGFLYLFTIAVPILARHEKYGWTDQWLSELPEFELARSTAHMIDIVAAPTEIIPGSRTVDGDVVLADKSALFGYDEMAVSSSDEEVVVLSDR